MTGSRAKRETFSPGDAGDGESFRRLIELQKQIIELVDQNSEAERRCRLLRHQLEREAEELFRRSRSLRHRLARLAASLLRRLYTNRRHPEPGGARPDLQVLPPVRQALER